MPILVCSNATDSILKYDTNSGAFLGIFAGGVLEPQALVIGSDAKIYVTNNGLAVRSVSRYHPDGSFDALFASDPLIGNVITDLEFDGDGRLYVANPGNNNVLRFNADGSFDRIFASGSGLRNPTGITFGSDLKLYVTSEGPTAPDPGKILRFNADGTFDQEFTTVRLRQPSDIVFYGFNAYVTDVEKQVVFSYTAAGVYQGLFATAGGLTKPVQLLFGPDGNLYVTSGQVHGTSLPGTFAGSSILRYNGSNGRFMGVFISGGFLDGAFGFVFQ